MTLPLRLVLSVLAGLAIGASLVFLAFATAVVLALSTGNRIAVPGLIEVWTSREPSGTTALEFIPDVAGAGLLVLGFAAVYTVATVVASRRRSRHG